MRSLIELSNEILITELVALRGKERAVVAETVRYLSELEVRGSYREAGYSSLFTFCTEHLGYSEGIT